MVSLSGGKCLEQFINIFSNPVNVYKNNNYILILLTFYKQMQSYQPLNIQPHQYIYNVAAELITFKIIPTCKSSGKSYNLVAIVRISRSDRILNEQIITL